MIHSPGVQTHQLEALHARVLLDTLGMELQERVLVSKTQVCPILSAQFCLHARVLLDTLGMELPKRASVSKTWVYRISCSPLR